MMHSLKSIILAAIEFLALLLLLGGVFAFIVMCAALTNTL